MSITQTLSLEIDLHFWLMSKNKYLNECREKVKGLFFKYF